MCAYRRGNLRLQAGAPHADHQRIPYKMTRGDSRSGWPDFDAGTADEVPGEPGVLVMHAAMKILHMGGPGNLRRIWPDGWRIRAPAMPRGSSTCWRQTTGMSGTACPGGTGGATTAASSSAWSGSDDRGAWRTAGMDNRDVRNAALALYGMIVRPGATIRRISDEPGRYLVPSVAILAAIPALRMLSTLSYAGYQMIDITWDVTLYGSIVGSMLNGLLLIAGIFWIGRKWGGNRSLRRAFPVLAYCLGSCHAVGPGGLDGGEPIQLRRSRDRPF